MLPQDIRFGLRTALKNKGVTGLAVVCLAIGIGLNTMMFSVTDGVLIQPLPYKAPARLVALYSANKQQGVRRAGLSLPDVRDWRERTRSFGAIATLQYRNFTVSDGGDTDRYSGAAVTDNLFSLLGIPPRLGRDFVPADDRHGGEPVVIISDDLWKRRYNSDPSIVGRGIDVNGHPHTVIGVMPPRFRFPENQYLWVPLSEFVWNSPRGNRGLQTFARLKDGVSLEQARGDADAVAAALAAAYPDTNKNWGAAVSTMRDWAIPNDVSLIIWTMMGAVTMVLLIACFNVANLMLARASTRAREMSIRTALGAGRGQILRQLLTESVIIGLLSVPLGILCAMGGLKLMDLSIPPDDVPYFIHWSLNWRAFVYAVAVAALTGIVFGLAPALQASKPDLQEGLKDGGRGTAGGGRAWMRNVLVVSEVALSLVLLIGASLFTRSFLQMKQASGGFDSKPLMTLRFYMPPNEVYANAETRVQRVQDVVRRVEALPGVQAAFASNLVPLNGGGETRGAIIDGHPPDKGHEQPFEFIGVTPHMLKTLGLTIRRGRELTDTESFARVPYAVVNDRMVKTFWPNEDPIGRRFKTDNPEEHDVWFTVVGVVADYRHGQLDDTDPIAPCAYVSLAYSVFANTGLVVRAAGDPASLAAPLREAVRASDPKIALFNVWTMAELRARGYWQYFLFGWMFSLFGGIALALAAIGVYGVLSYSVAQRTQEIGVRVALGASRMDVLTLVVTQGVRLAVAGVAIGVVGSFFVTPVIQSELVNVSAKDPASFAGVSIFLTAVAFVASYIPARRATAVDPLVALRAE